MILKLDRNIELARTVDVTLARAKRIYCLMIKVKKLFPFFVKVFSKKVSKAAYK